MKCPELLAPAGTRENLEIAIRYGADAVYQGLEGFSLRQARKAEMPFDAIEAALSYTHQRQKRYYLAMNLIAHEMDLEQLRPLLPAVLDLPLDGVIVADPGLVRWIRTLSPHTPIHLSTQSSVMNHEAIRFWKEQGAQRVILGRELSRGELARIRASCPDVELEMFVHGAMCMAYSGRCHLSHYFLNRDGNRGQCAQVCRWRFDLEKEQEPGFVEIEEDDRGTYLLNAKDLCLAPYIRELMEMDCLKIEGRNKTSYYIGNVVRVYRWLLDAVANETPANPEWITELERVSHRPYTAGFFDDRNDLFAMNQPGYIKTHTMVGIIRAVEGCDLVMDVRDTIKWGDELDVLGTTPGSDGVIRSTVEGHPNQTVRLTLPEPPLLHWQGALVRKKLT